ncbi:MAG: J domain-containing protein [Geminicoccaceae bacterium]
MSDELYKTLGVGKTASDDEIRKAYRRLVKTCHPDTNPDDRKAEERFKALGRAYAILGDAEKRKRYDRGLIDADGNERGPQGFGGFDPGRAGGHRTYHRSSGSGAEFSGFGGFDDVLSDLFGGRAGRRANARPRGEDLKLAVSVDFLEAVKGGKRRVGLPDGRHLDVTIPAGIEDARVLRLKGQGVAGGDALIEVQVRPHEGFRRDGLDIHLDHSIPLDLAIAGGRVTVPTIDGAVAVTVPAWTSSGRTLRLKGRGIAQGGRQGDQLVRLEILLPDRPDDALQRWAKGRVKAAV